MQSRSSRALSAHLTNFTSSIISTRSALTRRSSAQPLLSYRTLSSSQQSRAATTSTFTRTSKPIGASRTVTARTTPASAVAPSQTSSPARTTSAPPEPASSTPTPTDLSSTSISSDEVTTEPLRSLTEGLNDPPPFLDENERQVDWTRSFHGLSSAPFTTEQAAILQQELDPEDIEIKPDGIVYLPEIKYRRILNKAFRPGGWGLAPRGETIVTSKVVTREYGLVAGGRLISVARGEQQYFDPEGIPTATEGCKSNALMRCCKDLGIASELWDPRFIRKFTAAHAREMMVEHVVTKKRRKHWLRKDDTLRYPLKEVSVAGAR